MRMDLIAWIVVGLVGGVIARFLMPGADPGGYTLTVLLGIAGAILGGFVALTLGIGNAISDLDSGTIALSILGALVLLGSYRLVSRGQTTI